MTLAQRDRPDEALDAFSHAGVPEPEAHCNLAFAYCNRGRRQEAIQEYRTALRLAPDFEMARTMLAGMENPNAVKPVAPPASPVASAKPDLSSAVNTARENNAEGFAANRAE